LDWVFCDTDSMALAQPEGMDEATFLERAHALRDWFKLLNPYTAKGHVLKIEDANYRIERGKLTKELQPLNAYAVSAKRYVLFNLDPRGRPILRKASAHGLGHLRPPSMSSTLPRPLPAPRCGSPTSASSGGSMTCGIAFCSPRWRGIPSRLWCATSPISTSRR
jgi:hypothetical protein